MSLKNLLYTSYWFSQPNLAMGGVEKAYIIILLGLVLLAVAALLIRRRQAINAIRLLLLRAASFGFTMGITGLLLFWFRQQHVFFLGWRIWFGLWAVCAAVWVYRLVSYMVRRLSTIKADYAERQQREKYLSKR